MERSFEPEQEREIERQGWTSLRGPQFEQLCRDQRPFTSSWILCILQKVIQMPISLLISGRLSTILASSEARTESRPCGSEWSGSPGTFLMSGSLTALAFIKLVF